MKDSHNDVNDITRAATRTSTARQGSFLERVMTNRTAAVPRGKRRGLFSSVTIIPEVEDPLEYRRHTKNMVPY